jgi:urease accessory protein
VTAPAPEGALLSLLWLASPALPVGGFSYSEGLEAAVDAGRVHDEASAAKWLDDQLHLVLGRAELPLVAAAHVAWAAGDVPRVAALNDWLLATRESAEFRLQTLQMGRSLTDWLKQRDGEHPMVQACRALQPAAAWPVAFALAAQRSGAPLHDALQAFAFGWAENLVQAALKAVPLGQSAGQRLLARFVDAIPAVARQAASCTDDERQAFAPGLAILSARHEDQYSRLFRS